MPFPAVGQESSGLHKVLDVSELTSITFFNYIRTFRMSGFQDAGGKARTS